MSELPQIPNTILQNVFTNCFIQLRITKTTQSNIFKGNAYRGLGPEHNQIRYSTQMPHWDEHCLSKREVVKGKKEVKGFGNHQVEEEAFPKDHDSFSDLPKSRSRVGACVSVKEAVKEGSSDFGDLGQRDNHSRGKSTADGVTGITILEGLDQRDNGLAFSRTLRIMVYPKGARKVQWALVRNQTAKKGFSRRKPFPSPSWSHSASDKTHRTLSKPNGPSASNGASKWRAKTAQQPRPDNVDWSERSYSIKVPRSRVS